MSSAHRSRWRSCVESYRFDRLRKITLETVLKNELSPVPTPMLEDTGDMKIDHAKSKLKNKLQIEVTSLATKSNWFT